MFHGPLNSVISWAWISALKEKVMHRISTTKYLIVIDFGVNKKCLLAGGCLLLLR